MPALGELNPAALTEQLLTKLLEMYGAAERELLTKLATALTKGIDGEHWTERQLAELQRFRGQAEEVLAKLMADTPDVAAEAITRASNRGAAVAQAVESAGTVTAAVDTFAATALASELAGQLNASAPTIFRSVDDIYRRVIADTTGNALLGTQTRRDVADTALRRLARAGITGFVDRSGKRWELGSYVESASRSALMNATIEGHTQRLQANDVNLVIVSDVPQECYRCRPFEGKILAIGNTVPGGLAHEGRPIPVYGTLTQARRAGLFHPSCRHSLSRYIPGRTRSFGETADPEGDKARQKLRYLERQVRASKREELASITPEGQRAARARARAYQAKIREHVATTTAKRIRSRESITGAR